VDLLAKQIKQTLSRN